MHSTNTLARGAAAIVGAAACVALAGCTSAADPTVAPSPTSSPGAPVPTDPFGLRVGDCIDEDLADGEVMQVPVVDCDKPHTAEAYHSERLPDGSYPGLEWVKEAAAEACHARFEAFAGVEYDDSENLDFAWYYPTEGSWSTGDREVLCLIMRIDPATGRTMPTTGTLRGFAE